MTRAAENPPAFPVSDGTCTQQGMSLRDWFAGQALAGMLGADAAHGPVKQINPTALAFFCFEVADALLAARGDGQ